MISEKIKALLFILILGLFSCTNKSSNPEEEMTTQQEAAPILVANDKTEDTPSLTPPSVDEVITPTEELPASAPASKPKVNKKPSPAPKAVAVVEKIEKPEEKPEVIKEEVAPIVEKKVEESKPTIAPIVTKKVEEPKKIGASHEAWDALLRKYVSTAGQVNYKGFKASEAELDAYLDHLAQNPVKADWSKGDKMAYWINAYNAFTIKLIVENYPVSSITKLHGGKPWDAKWIKLGNQTYSLNSIENDILRPKFKDARIHFAVNCAAQSCPPILNRAWRGSILNSTFDKQAKQFINNPKFNKISAKEVQISKIFEWYAVDFGNIIDYLNKYSNTTINANAKVSYLEYDWALNN